MKGDILVITDGHRKGGNGVIDLLGDKILDPKGPIALSIAGESGSGKSELAEVIRERLEKQGVPAMVLGQDDYFVYPPKTNEMMRRKSIDHVGTREVRIDLLDRNIEEVKGGAESIRKPLVDFDEDRIDQDTLFLDGIRVVIAEGTYTTALRSVDFRVFIDRTKEDTREARAKRAREAQDDFLERVLAIEHGIISKHRERADFVVNKDWSVSRGEAKHDA